MPQLTERAQKVIEHFKQQIELLPVDERASAIKQMTEYLSSLNKEALGIVSVLKNNPSKNTSLQSETNTCSIDDITEFI